MIAAKIVVKKYTVFSFGCRNYIHFYQIITICQFENIDKTGIGC